MARSKNNPKNAGPEAFSKYYLNMHGSRWSGLVDACRTGNRHFGLNGGLLKTYYLDPASVIASLCLDIMPGQQVLDMCAAPGGKSLVIAQRLFGLVPAAPSLSDLGQLSSTMSAEFEETGNADQDTHLTSDNAPEDSPGTGYLVANELSANRRGRLRQVLAEHLPAHCEAKIKTSGFDATAWGQYEQGRYDRVLLDVPCSSERHLIQDPAYLTEWSPKRSTQLAQQAYAMGLSAGRALKTNGILLYCTCALSDLENDAVVSRIIERSSSQAGRFGYQLAALGPVDLTSPARQLADMANYNFEIENSVHGQRIWPDRCGGFGPLYFARLQKTNSNISD